MKDIFLGYVGKTLNLPNEQLAELLYKKSDDGAFTEDVSETALQTLLDLDAKRVQALKPNTKEIFDNGYKKAQSEVLTRYEKTLREKFAVAEDLTGDALIEALAAAKEGDHGKKDVKTHPDYLSLEKAMQKREQELLEQMQSEVEKVKSEYVKEQAWQSAQAEIRKAARALNPVLPEGDKGERLLELFVNNNFRQYEYQPDGNGGFVLLKDGQRVENAHGHVKELPDLVRDYAEQYFEFRQQSPAGNAGNAGTGGGANVRFRDDADYFQQRAAAAGDAKRQAELAAAWRAQNAN